MGSVPGQKEIREGRSWKEEHNSRALATHSPPHSDVISLALWSVLLYVSHQRGKGFNSERSYVFCLALFYSGSPSFEILVFLSNSKTGWPGDIFC